MNRYYFYSLNNGEYSLQQIDSWVQLSRLRESLGIDLKSIKYDFVFHSSFIDDLELESEKLNNTIKLLN